MTTILEKSTRNSSTTIFDFALQSYLAKCDFFGTNLIKKFIAKIAKQ